MTRVEILRRRRVLLSIGILALVLCACVVGASGSISQPKATTLIGRLFGALRTTGPLSWGLHHTVGRNYGDNAVVIKRDDGTVFPDTVRTIGSAHLFISHSGSGVWVGSRMSLAMAIQIIDDSGTLTQTELFQIRRSVCDLFRPSATPAESSLLATLATGDVIDARLVPVGVALEVLITLMVAGAVGLGVWRYRVGRELGRWERLELEGVWRCPKCGYEVWGLAVCPECGVEVREQ
jgi:hypothetical protein